LIKIVRHYLFLFIKALKPSILTAYILSAPATHGVLVT